MKKFLFLAYGVVAYLAFFVTVLYMIGFLGNFIVPKAINDGAQTPLAEAITVNLLLVLAFAVQHTIMARPAFKRWWTQFVPKPIERSTFVLLASAILLIMFWQWRPIPVVLWSVENAVFRAIIFALFMLGWVFVFYSSFLINHFDLFGLRQVFLHFRNQPYKPVQMKVVSLYRLVRNPLMLGFFISVWATPLMTYGHLLFAASMTAYIFAGIQFEERTLYHELGSIYQDYRRRTPMLFPIPGKRTSSTLPDPDLGAATEHE